MNIEEFTDIFFKRMDVLLDQMSPEVLDIVFRITAALTIKDDDPKDILHALNFTIYNFTQIQNARIAMKDNLNA